MNTAKVQIKDNQARIFNNAKFIEENKREITELKNYTFSAFESAIARYEKIIHRLIIVIGFTIALLVITNAIWIYGWYHNDKTTVNNGNYVGNDGSIERGE